MVMRTYPKATVAAVIYTLTGAANWMSPHNEIHGNFPHAPCKAGDCRLAAVIDNSDRMVRLNI